MTTSIFVRDLPEGMTPEKLEAAFSRFGKVKGGAAGVNLKQQKGKEDFAFIEFEEAATMQAAIDAEVVIEGRKVREPYRLCWLPLFIQKDRWNLCGTVHARE